MSIFKYINIKIRHKEAISTKDTATYFAMNIPQIRFLKQVFKVSSKSPRQTKINVKKSNSTKKATVNHNSRLELKPFANLALNFIEKILPENTLHENTQYQHMKTMLILWNPEASQWAINISNQYRMDMQKNKKNNNKLVTENIYPFNINKVNVLPIQDAKSITIAKPNLNKHRSGDKFDFIDTYVEQCYNCSRKISKRRINEPDNTSAYNVSMCSLHSFQRGYHQQVMAFSFYRNKDSKQEKERNYFLGIKENLELLPKFYPGWILRLYYDIEENHPLMKSICELACANSNLDICFIRNIPAAGDLSKVFAMNWRFLPLLDTQVDTYVSRDLDSRLSIREEAAVAEWKASGKAFHFMRDHPAHSIEILGSAWGVNLKGDLERKYAKESFLIAAKDPIFWAPRSAYGPDQGFLKRYIWPWSKWNALSHDSYTCATFPRTSSFPTERKLGPNNFIAAVALNNDTLTEICPKKCRPKNHQEWKYC